ncbi:MAG TPA: copper resistance protein CopC [Nitrososphaeraceae archaeon]
MTEGNNSLSNKCTSYPFILLIILSTLLSISILIFTPFVVHKSYGHAFVIDSNPSPSQSLKTPPSNVQVSLSEPVDVRYSKVSVVDANGKVVDKKDVHYVNGDHTLLSVSLPSATPDGVYTVSTKMLSEVDGHVTDNAFVFGVGKATIPSNVGKSGSSSTQPSSQLSVPDVIARFPSLVGQVIIVGGAFATLWIWKPISKIAWINISIEKTKRKINRSFLILMLVGSIILVTADFAMIYVQAYSINASVLDAIATNFGGIWVIRIILSLILFGISLAFSLKKGIIRSKYFEKGRIKKLRLKKTNTTLASSTSSSDSPKLTKKTVVSFLVIGTLTLLTTSLISHGAAVTKSVIPITIDFIHNLAASFWIGGLIYIAFVVIPKLKASSVDEYIKGCMLSILLPRFSIIPVTVLGIIVVTGPFLLYILESNLALTIASFYGKALIVKLVLAAIMIGIGCYNQAVIHTKALQEASVLAVKPTIRGGADYSVKNGRRFLQLGRIYLGLRRPSNGSPDSKYRPSMNRKTKNYVTKDKKAQSSPSTIAICTAVSKFNKTTKAEAILGIALLAAVAVMVNSGLPASEFQNLIQQQKQQQQQTQLLPSQIGSQPFTSTGFTEDGNNTVVLSIDPFTPGSNNFQVKFLDLHGNPVDINSAKMRLTQTEKGIGPIEVDTKPVSNDKGVYSSKASFGLPGKWEIQVEGTPNKKNEPSIVGTFDLLVKPSLDQIKFGVEEFRIPSGRNNNNGTVSQPLYTIYDKSRNAIWVGDTAIDSGRILEFDLNTGKYILHKVNGTSIITGMALDPNNNNRIWYIDPLNKFLGVFDINTKTNQNYRIQSQGPLSGIAIGSNSGGSVGTNTNKSEIWITLPSDNSVLKFDSQNKNFTKYSLPTPNAGPLGIAIHSDDGLVWVAEGGSGKIASIDPNKNYKITEYEPKNNSSSNLSNKNDSSLKSPTALLIDPDTDNIYMTEHDGHAITMFDPILKTFKRYSGLDPKGLPFGMAFDSYHNIWVAEHVINKISVIDPRTGAHKEVNIPARNPFAQWLTSDSSGNIWFAEQRGDSLGVIKQTLNPLQSNTSSAGSTSSLSSQSNTKGGNSNSNSNNSGIPQLGFTYADVVGPTVALGIIFSAIIYTRSVISLKQSQNVVSSIKSKHDEYNNNSPKQ